jgi:hypothetical protein
VPSTTRDKVTKRKFAQILYTVSVTSFHSSGLDYVREEKKEVIKESKAIPVAGRGMCFLRGTIIIYL